MRRLAELVEQHPAVAQSAFSNIEAALNLVLPRSDVHARYQGASEIGLAVVVGHTSLATYNPFTTPPPTPSFRADNQSQRPSAWEAWPADSEFLEGRQTELGRFAFIALAKTENMRITGGLSSYDPDRLTIEPGRVGFAGGRRLLDGFVTHSGLWEVHDHAVSGVYATELAEVIDGVRNPRSSDDLAAHFEREFARIQALHEGVAAADMSHADIGKLLPLVDQLPYAI